MSKLPEERTSSPNQINRRRFIHKLAIGAGAVATIPLLNACGDPSTPTVGSSVSTAALTPTTVASSVSTTAASTTTSPTTAAVSTTAASTTVAASSSIKGSVTVMTPLNEFDQDDIKRFNQLYPNIGITIVDWDMTKLDAMIAAGNPPDLFRTSGGLIPNLVSRKLLYDLTDYFNSSTIVKVDDLASANDLYVYEGRRYGMAKDWSPDFSMFINTDAFKEVGLPLPTISQPLTYAQVGDMARKLTKRQGDRTLRIGFAGGLVLARTLQVILGEVDQKLYKPDFSAIILKDNPTAVDVLKWYYSLAKDNATWNPLNPDPDWPGADFAKGQLAMVQYGMWYQGSLSTIKDSVVEGKAMPLPGLSWTGKKLLNPTVSATGFVITKATKNPDAAWKWFEFYLGGEPAKVSAKKGWGVPALKSFYPLLPSETPLQKQCLAVLQEDLKHADFKIDLNPYYDDNLLDKTWTKNLEQGLRGSLSFENMIQNVENDVNKAITEGRAKISK